MRRYYYFNRILMRTNTRTKTRTLENYKLFSRESVDIIVVYVIIIAILYLVKMCVETNKKQQQNNNIAK